MIITPLQTSSDEGKQTIQNLTDRFQLADSNCRQTVEEILSKVRTKGDSALLSYINKFDSPSLKVEGLKVSADEFDAAASQVSNEFQKTLDTAINRI